MVTRTGPIVVTRTGKVHKGERSSRAFFRFDLDLDRHETSASASSIFRSPIQAAPGESITGDTIAGRMEVQGHPKIYVSTLPRETEQPTIRTDAI